MNEQCPTNINTSNKSFSQKDLSACIAWVIAFANRLGSALIPKILMVIALLMDPQTPKKDRRIVIGVLFYLVLPTDLVPDVIPVAGLVDDVTALFYAISAVAYSLRVRHLRSAADEAVRWGFKFPSVPDAWDDDAKLVDLPSAENYTKGAQKLWKWAARPPIQDPE